jgi:integrase
MTFDEAIDSYLQYKRSAGLVCNYTERCLKHFRRTIGDVPLGRITTEQVQSFLDASKGATSTWRHKYGILKNFFEHWSWRGEMPFLMMPTIRPAERGTFVPYIYTKSEIRSILASTKSSQKRAICKADAKTLRMFILMLYATGARYSEIVTLKGEDIAFKQSRLTLHGSGYRSPRCIPIGPDLKRELQAYLRSRHQRSFRNGPLFLGKTGLPLRPSNLSLCFRRVRVLVGLTREDVDTFDPRLHDLRFTFAVHRITSWIKSGADLNRLIPALSTYMGNLSLESADEYLSLTPERFRKELQKLSPKRGHKRWRDDPALMRFLSTL